MPRSGWLALGSVVAALAATQPWVGRAWLTQPATWLLLGGSWLAVVARWGIRGGSATGRSATGRSATDRGRGRSATDHGPVGGRSPARGRPSGRLSFVAPCLVAIAGALLIGGRLTVAPVPGGVGATVLPEGTGPWLATVEAIGNPRDGRQIATVRVARDGAPTVRVSVTTPSDPPMTVGDTVGLVGRLQPPPGDDYGAYLLQAGVDATLQSRTLAVVASGHSPGALVDRARRSAADGLALALPEPEAGLAAGILIGLRDRVDRNLATAFTTAGLSHVVAISGWNIAIVAALVGAALRGWPRRRRSFASLCVIGLFTVLTGGSASVVRAALMAAVVTLARESGRAGSAASALGWAAVVILVVDPATVGDAGFQLSSLATAGLIAWGTPLTDRLRAWRGGALPGWLCEGLGVSFAAEAATLPVVLLAFGRLALLAPLANLLVVPLVPAAMAAGTIALVGGVGAEAGLPREFASLTGLPGWMTLTLIVAIVQVAAALPFASVSLTPPLNLVAAGMVAAMVAVAAVKPARAAAGMRLQALAALVGSYGSRRPRWMRRIGACLCRAGSRRRPRRAAARAQAPSGHPGRATGPQGRSRTRLLAVTLAASIAGLVLIAAHRADGTVRIDVLDVGQGDAILVQGDHGARMLVDGGPDPGRLLVALDAQLPPWDRRIDLLVLTHPHEDHVAGMARLLEQYRVRRVVQPGMIGPGPGYQAFASWLLEHDRRAETIGTGDTIALDSIAIQVLWPDPGTVPTRPTNTGSGINNVSVVLLGMVEGHRFLLMGDIEEDIDPILVGRGLPRVDVLKVAHHGSRTSSTGPFLDAVEPAIAVVSAGAKNPYGHPAPATIGRLAARGTTVFRTDRNGTVDLALQNGRWLARPQRETQNGPERPSPSPPVTGTVASLAVFRCGVPQPGLAPPSDAPATVGATDGRAVDVLYDRPDVRAEPSGGRPPAPAPGSPALAPPPLPGRGGDRRLARSANRGSRDAHRPPSRGGGGPAARCRQAARVSASVQRAPPRRRRGRLADSTGTPGTRPGRGESPGDSPGR